MTTSSAATDENQNQNDIISVSSNIQFLFDRENVYLFFIMKLELPRAMLVPWIIEMCSGKLESLLERGHSSSTIASAKLFFIYTHVPVKSIYHIEE